jgi:hypothetical protein
VAEAVGPDELKVEVVVGENVSVTPAVREALDNLARALNEEMGMQDEVAGFVFQPGLQVGGLSQPGASGAPGAGPTSAVGGGGSCVIHYCSMKARFPGMTST